MLPKKYDRIILELMNIYPPNETNKKKASCSEKLKKFRNLTIFYRDETHFGNLR